MEIYFAPLEGITGYLYRSAYRDNFSGVNKYFTPFLSPNQNRALGPKEIKDILPENNKGMHVVQQVLTNRAELFLQAARACSNIQRPTGIISPVSSRIGINSPGEIILPSGE